MHRRNVTGPLILGIVILALFLLPLGSRPTETLSGDGLAAGARPVPSASPQTSGPIRVTTSNVTIDGVTITSSATSGSAISVIGTASSPIHDITIRNCTLSGFGTGIEVRYAQNVVIDNCTVTDADYAGIALYSTVGGRITNNTVQRIGTTRTNFSSADANNAYGITLDRRAVDSLATDPRSADVVVDHNLVEDVPLWMGLNTHAGANLTFSNNVVRRTPRAIFVAGDGSGNGPIAITITGNRLEQPVTKDGGTTNIEGILYSHLDGGSITGNAVDRRFGSANGTDYEGVSTGVTISGNAPLPAP